MYYTYVLLSVKDNKIYIGWSGNLKQRFSDHNKGIVRTTKGRRPFKLVYYEACLSESLAKAREKYFKTGSGRAFLKDRIGPIAQLVRAADS